MRLIDQRQPPQKIARRKFFSHVVFMTKVVVYSSSGDAKMSLLGAGAKHGLG